MTTSTTTPTGPRKIEKEYPKRSPLVAGLLSLILPGSGHIYTGRTVQGLGYMTLAITMGLLLWWTNTTHEFEVFPGMIPALIVLAALFHVWQIASAVRSAIQKKFLPTIGLLVVLAFIYLLGWQVTEVDLQKFFTEFSDTFNIFTKVMWPWEAAIEREQEMMVAITRFGNPCVEGEIPEQVEGDGSEPWVAISPACGEFATYKVGEGLIPGDVLTIYGGGFEPNKEVEIWWRDPIGQEFRPRSEGTTVTTMADENGNFSVTFPAHQYDTPAVAQGVQVHQAQARQVAAVGAAKLSPNFSLALGRMIVTIFQALMATSFGIVLAIPFSFLAARNLMQGSRLTMTIYYAVRFVMNVARSIEPIIWAVIATVWVGLGPFAGVIALTIHTVAALGKLYSEAIESIQPGPIEAITATGATRLQTIMYAIIPQVIPPFLSFTIYRWDINVRMSTIIGFVGGGGIGQILFQWINQSRWNAAGMAVWLIAITVSLMDYGSAELRKRFI
ncbi:MAG: hypothetical protein Kow00124_32530 [Anaerolineae bacterium]